MLRTQITCWCSARFSCAITTSLFSSLQVLFSQDEQLHTIPCISPPHSTGFLSHILLFFLIPSSSSIPRNSKGKALRKYIHVLKMLNCTPSPLNLYYKTLAVSVGLCKFKSTAADSWQQTLMLCRRWANAHSAHIQPFISILMSSWFREACYWTLSSVVKWTPRCTVAKVHHFHHLCHLTSIISAWKYLQQHFNCYRA